MLILILHAVHGNHYMMLHVLSIPNQSRYLGSRPNGSRRVGTVDQMVINCLGVDVMGVDVFGVDGMALIRSNIRYAAC